MTMAQQVSPLDLTPKHVRAARALLAWSQHDLAKQAGVATSTVADFERGQRIPVANNAQAIRTALENAGIRFLPTGAVIGPAIPNITPSERAGAPIRWVDAEDLSVWANRTEGVLSMPTLVSHLIRATAGTAVHLRFPADEGVQHPGWDGQTYTDTGNSYVPKGEAGWEIGSQRRDIERKVTEDYRKRTDEPAPFDPANASFVFVTPRHWPGKDKWAKAREAEGPWANVRVYDADDLVHWIEQTPVVGLWLAVRLGKRPEDTRELEEVWEEWSLAAKWPLTEELVLSDRDEEAADLLRWLRSKPSVFSLQATTTDEVVSFFYATLAMLPDEVKAAYKARCLVATTAAAARALANAPGPLIVVMTEPDPGIAHALAGRGHYVLQAYDERPISRGDVRALPRPSREGIASALVAAGIAQPRAEAYARDSARNLAVLRRLIPSAPGRRPQWAEVRPPQALLAALLAGGWDEDAEADKARLAELADEPYDAIARDLMPYVGRFDSPLQKIGSTWRIASPQDAWFLLARHLTGVDIKRFEAAAHAVLGSVDPRFEMDPDERWMASVRGVQRDYSGMLRHGIGQVLILLALWGEEIKTIPDAARRADHIVAKLLANATKQRWWSLSRDFRLLAEASPSAFLRAIEDSLDLNDPPIRALFGRDGEGVFGAEHLSDLLWALESLAWSPELMPKVTHVLARLDAIDNPPGQYANRPANSLRAIHLLWLPQTYATLDLRLRALDLIRKHERDAAWKLMLSLLPQGHDTSIPSPMPLWRDFTVDEVEVATWATIGRGAVAITERVLVDVGLDAARWTALLDRFADLSPDTEGGFSTLEAAEPRITKQIDRAAIWAAMRRVLHHHRQFPDAEWSMPSQVLDRLEAIYERFAPADPIERVAWLFEQDAGLPRPSAEGWKTNEREVDLARKDAAHALFSKDGIPAILALSRKVGTAGYIGKALFAGGLSEPDLEALLESAIRSEDAHERALAHGLIVSAFAERKEPWAAELIAKATSRSWGDTALLTILRALPGRRWTWDQATSAGAEIEETYWRQTPVFWMSDDRDEVGFAIRKLISVGRARHALPLAARDSRTDLLSDLLIEVLLEAVRQPFESEGDRNEATMFQHYVAEILQVLDKRDDVDSNALVKVEWAYLPILTRSRRPPKVLMKALSEQPSFFVQILSAVFKASEESGVVDVEPQDPERARAIATQAYRLLEEWDRLPGTKDDGTIDNVALEGWIKEARSLAKTAGREDIADSRIGNVLAASPFGADGNWPAEAVRDAIDLFRSKPMINGFLTGKMNRRGVTMRSPRDGGELERKEAAKYRGWSNAISFDHPHTAKALDTLADNYEAQAHRHDQSSERLDWE
ncbi:helix-turn-helix transcriptional regulator [Mesorhizobium sp. B2-5-9]|uniref:helix-turn-helix domain-containing protein n=2 Tax=Phyllobacteriaceae TaxID=69277 RepID=UPI000A0606A2|nr:MULTISPECIES: helix-turn-helix transcriptional regulator [unclassified Mesorhizobium]ARP67166.1 XRE family transcriptional regulator [Mesorhizobium sp. WSM1497]PBC13833.1 XRE family transcriptional regulator [Mesorhizobium loti]TPI78943.1 helix-turn-helix transcriptional regulator [Mesorhizobium sp. B2-8-9]TPJ26758.1 helix-turn-helix transcriptional regulator [Mesorhizobium sp. B2-7-2]TPJ36012.1 helix-turn-helix transcriptional regulator [Mesorhizobium sp. B2-6-5]TPJ38308.1 helix-turn-heli